MQEKLTSFKELEYVRPNMKEIRKLADICAAQARAAGSADELYTAVVRGDELSCRLETVAAVAKIRSDMDMSDTALAAEIEYLEKSLPRMTPSAKKLLRAVLTSPCRPELEKRLGSQLFRISEERDRTQKVRNIPGMIREGLLGAEYQRTAAGCSAVFRGGRCNFYGLLRYMEDPDPAVRESAGRAWAGLYCDAAPKLDKLYDRLCRVRRRMASGAGFPSYVEFAYAARGRLSYTPADVARFRGAIEKYAVPAAARIRKRQAERLGLASLRFWDETLFFPEGNPLPIGGEKELLAAAERMYRALSPETGEFFGVMLRRGLFDLSTRPGKHLGGYCASLPFYKLPFIFSNFNGTSADVDVLTHEAGHAFEYYTASRAQPVSDYRSSTSEVNEIHSMAMEYFTYPWMEGFFGGRAEDYRLSHLCSAVCVLPYMACVDEFQHAVFAGDLPTAEGRRKLWLEAEKKYMPWRDYGGIDFLRGGGYWMQKQHIFLYPFYYIDYALAAMGAFELFLRSKTDPKGAWEAYMSLCRAGGSMGYRELLSLAGLSDPFDPDSVGRIMEGIEKETEKY